MKSKKPLSNVYSKRLLDLAKELSSQLKAIDFSSVAFCVYDPLQYAFEPHAEYLKKYVHGPVRVLYLGMNPGPWGMVQTGIPFGEVAAVRDWLQIESSAVQPSYVHPKRPIQGLQCTRSEVSGKRLWGLFRDRYGDAKSFFKDQFVGNYCPLAFMDEQARNLTPDKFPIALRTQLESICDQHLKEVIATLKPEFLIGIGAFAEACGMRALPTELKDKTKVLRVLHPSPASPAANRDWSGSVTKTLVDAGVWC
ncbi:MAG: single-stranded DNA-binding protein [Planctomycetota bacterium]|jgi:single-strand selective monofunctional uracil DNA glycosylase|nr:single-stranded DNA-binding protein [Planctomycetota bacterium]